MVIPSFNSEKTIEACLNSFEEQTRKPHEIIIVDGGSTDSTIGIVRRFEYARVISKPGTAGFCRNLGAKVASGEIILFCDSDCVADQKLLEYHLKSYKGKKDLSGVMGALRSLSKKKISTFVQKRVIATQWLLNLNRDGTVRLICSANFSMKRDIFLEYKFRKELTSCEDAELSFRLNRDGRKVLYEPRAFVYHHHRSTVEGLFEQLKWHGEGLYELWKIYGERLNALILRKGTRYCTFSEDLLHEAVFDDQRLLCRGCELDFQGCRIRGPKIPKNTSDVGLHRITCLAVAAGILKGRTLSDYHPNWNEIETPDAVWD